MKWLTPLNERGCLVLNSNHQSYLYSKHCPAPLTRKFHHRGRESHPTVGDSADAAAGKPCQDTLTTH